MSGAIYSLPNEVLLVVIAHLELSNLLSFRQTCRLVYETTEENKVIWLRYLEQQKGYLPLYTSILDPRSDNVLCLSADVLRARVLLGQRLDCLWLKQRPSSPRKLKAPTSEHLLVGLDLLEDRWLLVVYGQAIHLWDLDDDKIVGKLTLQREGLTSFCALYDDNRILIAVKRHSFISPFVTVLYQVSVHPPHEFVVLCSIRTNTMQLPRYIDPSANIIVSAHACLVELVDWTDPDKSAVQIPTEGEAIEEMYTAINAVRLFGPYMVLFKTRSIELHPLPTQFQHHPHPHSLPILKHTFSNTYRSYAISETQHGTFHILASDLIQGLFHYTVHITLWPTDLCVTLNGAHSLSNLLYRQNAARPFARQDDDTYHQQSSVASYSPKQTISTHIANKGFVTAYCMGSKGMRAIWVQRSRENMLREVVAARLCSSDSVHEVPDIEARPVYQMHSVDLRVEDLMHLTVGEASGKIILGNRAGEVFVLDVDKD